MRNAFGEAQLFALASSQRGSMVITGDKRAVQQLARSEASSCIRSLAGRVVCLEAALWGLVNREGVQSIHHAFSAVAHHKTLKVVLTEHTRADQRQCLDAIRSYYDAIHVEAKGLLYNPAPRLLGRD